MLRAKIIYMGRARKNKFYSLGDITVFLAPAAAGTFIFVIIPVIISFGISFLEWDFLSNPVFVGFKNYVEIFTDQQYIKIFYNTIIYSFFVTVFGVLLPLILAYMVFSKFKFLQGFKLICFLPYITPMVVIGSVWCWIFDPSSGLINGLFHTDCKWLYDPNLAMPILIFVSVWKLLGYNMVLYLAGFAGLNISVIEAAKVDGASDLKILSKIIIPMLIPVIVFVTSATVISSFQVFDLIYIMTQGGPDNATNVLVYNVYQEGFEYFQAGKSCALGYILFLLFMTVILVAKGFRTLCVKNCYKP